LLDVQKRGVFFFIWDVVAISLTSLYWK